MQTVQDHWRTFFFVHKHGAVQEKQKIALCWAIVHIGREIATSWDVLCSVHGVISKMAASTWKLGDAQKKWDRLSTHGTNVSLTDMCGAAVADYTQNARLQPQCNAYTQCNVFPVSFIPIMQRCSCFLCASIPLCQLVILKASVCVRGSFRKLWLFCCVGPQRQRRMLLI
jgi:hypothetical protein